MDRYIKSGIAVVILTLITTNVYYYTSLKTAQAENKTLQEAIKNPAVVEKPKTIIQKVIVYKTKPDGSTETTTTTTNIVDNGSESKPTVPIIPESIRRWSLLAEYDLQGSFGGGLGYQPFKKMNISLGGKYNTKSGLGVFGILRF